LADGEGSRGRKGFARVCNEGAGKGRLPGRRDNPGSPGEATKPRPALFVAFERKELLKLGQLCPALPEVSEPSPILALFVAEASQRGPLEVTRDRGPWDRPPVGVDRRTQGLESD